MRLTFARAALLGTVAAAALVTTPAIAQENADTKPATPEIVSLDVGNLTADYLAVGA